MDPSNEKKCKRTHTAFLTVYRNKHTARRKRRNQKHSFICIEAESGKMPEVLESKNIIKSREALYRLIIRYVLNTNSPFTGEFIQPPKTVHQPAILRWSPQFGRRIVKYNSS